MTFFESQLSISIRLAETLERSSLESLQWRASLNNPGDRDALLANPDAIEIPVQQIEDSYLYVAETSGSVVGFAGILPREDGNIELDALFVEPDAWRQGIGRSLVEYCVSKAMVLGADSIHVVGNPHAEGFYLACGFQLLGTEQMRFGIGLNFKRNLT